MVGKNSKMCHTTKNCGSRNAESSAEVKGCGKCSPSKKSKSVKNCK